MNRYSSYKDSGVEWIGEIPSEWGVSSLKYISEVLPSNVDKHIYPDEIQVKLCNYTDVYYNDYITRELELKKGSCNQNEYNKFQIRVDDVIITKDSESPDDIGIPTLIKDQLDNVVCGYHLTMLRPHSINGRFLFRFIQSNRTRRYFEINSSGITRYSLGKSSIENLSVPLPPLNEQHQIVSYLDNKTSSIDSLIQSKEKKIELLKEKRTSLINQVVTKGLNPDVEMKDSGVEWIGEIPSHWDVSKIKFLSKIISKGTTPSTIGKEILDEGHIFYIKMSDFGESYVKTPSNFIDEETNKLLSRSSLSEGDILFVITGEIGKTVIVNKEVIPSNINQNISFIRLKDLDKVKFTWYWLSSDVLNKNLKTLYNVSTLPSLSMEDLGNLYLPQPNKKEQQKIVGYLDKETKLIDETISSEQKKIELLKEYKQSLISEVVTGKRKVVLN